MNRSRTQPRPSAAAATARRPAGGVLQGDLPRRICLVLLAALVATASLAPADGPPREGLGVLIASGSLLLLAGWLLASFFGAGVAVRLGKVELLLGLFLALVAASALVMGGRGNMRATVNSLWVWVSFGAVYFLARQLAVPAVERRALAAGFVALAAGLSVYGCHQYFIELPQTRAAYQRDPEAALREAGVFAPPGSPLRKQFEDRLMSSVEPIGTFALANSFAGLLTPWMIAAVGIGVVSLRTLAANSAGRFPSAVATAAACAAAIGFCLLLTKSRSAWVGSAAGMGMVLVASARQARFSTRKLLAGAAGAAALGGLLVAIALAAGALDAEVFSEAVKSLSFRAEYWRATLAMIADYPLLGCGPGNFQEYYAAYKLPQASETIADPHNFLLEIWATAGTAAFAAWLALLAVAGVALSWRRKGSAVEAQGGAQSGDGEAGGGEAASGAGSPLVVLGGLYLGLLVANVHNTLIGRQAPPAAIGYCALALGLVWIGLRGWVRHGWLPRWLVVAALAGLLVNLLAAGGLTFPNVAMGGWLLLALGIASSPAGARQARQLSQAEAAAVVLAAVLLLAAIVVSAYTPLLRSQTLLAGAEQATTAREQVRLLKQAAAADRFSAEPWRRLAIVTCRQHLASGDRDYRKQCQAAIAEMLERDKRSNLLRQLAGDLRMDLWRKSGVRQDLESAVEAYRQAVELHHASAFLHAQYAYALDLAGESHEAARQADVAIQLDCLNPHQELDLSKRSLHTGQYAGDGSPLDKPAEPFLVRLRKTSAKKGLGGEG